MFEVPFALCSSIMFSLSMANGPTSLDVASVRNLYIEAQGLSDRAIQTAYLAAFTGSCRPHLAQSQCDTLASVAGIYLDNSIEPVYQAGSRIRAYDANLQLQLGHLTGQCQ